MAAPAARQRVHTAVLPLAGQGTRLLPLTRTVPKELLPVGHRPMVESAVLEALFSGIQRVVLVLGPGKGSLADHFAPHASGANRSSSAYAGLERIWANVEVISVMQPDSRGLGSAVLASRPVVGNDPFAVILADDLIDHPRPALRQLLDHHEQCPPHTGVVAVMEVPRPDTRRYGVCAGEAVSRRELAVHTLVEKPEPEAAPSTTAIVGRYVLPSSVFDALAHTCPGVDGEVQLTDALVQLAHSGRLRAVHFDGQRFDAGNLAGLHAANAHFAEHDLLATWSGAAAP